ncbi:MAG: hypothetical protein HYX52_08185 [Chloroflexi bacterium]|nr:hypothetical protein [Chloroflexota bacterium]
MSIRALRPTDVVAVSSLLGSPNVVAVAAHAWPFADPEGGGASLLDLTAASFQPGSTRRRVWIATDRGKAVGVAGVRSRAGGLVWDLELLDVLTHAEDEAVQLCEALASAAEVRAARRVLLMANGTEWSQRVARRAGFERYTGATLFRLAPGFRAPKGDAFEARPRLRSDEQPLYQLYSAAVPPSVRAAEAMTIDEWQGLHRGSRAWRPTLAGARQQLVWELGASLAGWMELTFGDRSQFVDLMVHPKYADAVDRFVAYALHECSPKAPVYVLARDYAAGLAPALHTVGFADVGLFDLFVKMLAQRVPERALATATLVGG